MMNMHWFAYAILLLAVVYEAIALVNGQPGDTLTEITWTLSQQWPILPFAAGVIAGHLFWRGR